MMAPTVVLGDGAPELVLGSAGSNRIRSAILQVIVNVVDRGMDARRGGATRRGCTSRTARLRRAGVEAATIEAAGYTLARFRDAQPVLRRLQAVARDPDGALSGGGDPRRGGAVVAV